MNIESDIDLAILPKHPLESWDRWTLTQDLADLLKKKIDIIDLRKASTVMKMQVVSKGECLYEADQKIKNRFENYVYSSYARLNEERHEIIKDILKRGKVYG